MCIACALHTYTYTYTACASRRYMLIASYAFFMLTGTVGFLSCFIFVRIIYGAVKVE